MYHTGVRVLIAPQEFKGTLSAEEAAAAMANGARAALPSAEIDLLPMADGGPGTVAAIVAATGGELRQAVVSDPLGRAVQAEWGRFGADSAVIEMAAAAGLWRLWEDERDPGVTTTRGVGELLLAVLDAGCRRITIGMGGSATNDGGAGMAQALGVRLLDGAGRELPPGGMSLAQLARLDLVGVDPRLAEAQIVAASDVMSPLCGLEGASLVFAPQKGATPAGALELDAALARYADVIRDALGVNVADVPGAGAAGGLGAGLIAFLRAEIRPGVEVVGEVVGLEQRVRQADVVLTGEGCLDSQTLAGKTVAGVARLAQRHGRPVVVVAGSLGPGWERILPLVIGVEAIVGGTATAGAALEQPRELLAATTARALAGWRRVKEMA